MKNNLLYITNVNLNKINGASVHIKKFLQQIGAHNIKCKAISYTTRKNIINDFLFHIKSTIFIIKHIHLADYIYIRYFPLCFLQIIIGKILNKPIVLEYNSVIEEELKYINRRWLLLNSFVKFLSRASCCLSSAIVVLSEGIGQYIEKSYRTCSDKIIVSSNGGDLREYSEKPVNRRGLIMFSDVPWYNMEEILGIKEELSRYDITLKIHIAKPISQSKDHRVEVNKEIHYNEFDFGLIIIDPEYGKDKYKYGIRPIKYFEYLSNGLAVVVPDIKDINRVTSNYNVGLVYKSAKEDLISTIVSLYDNEESLKSMQNNAVSLIKDSYNWNSVVGKLLESIEGRL